MHPGPTAGHSQLLIRVVWVWPIRIRCFSWMTMMMDGIISRVSRRRSNQIFFKENLCRDRTRHRVGFALTDWIHSHSQHRTTNLPRMNRAGPLKFFFRRGGCWAHPNWARLTGLSTNQARLSLVGLIYCTNNKCSSRGFPCSCWPHHHQTDYRYHILALLAFQFLLGQECLVQILG